MTLNVSEGHFPIAAFEKQLINFASVNNKISTDKAHHVVPL